MDTYEVWCPYCCESDELRHLTTSEVSRPIYGLDKNASLVLGEGMDYEHDLIMCLRCETAVAESALQKGLPK